FDVGDPVFMVNTHWHGDHTAGNVVYGEEATIIAHANTRLRLSERQTPWWYPEGIGPIHTAGWPDLTFTDSLSLYFNGEEVQLLHFGPAHSDGDAIVFFRKAEVIHMGDLYHGVDGFSVGEDMHGLAHTLAEVIRRVPARTLIVTGHGEVTDRAELSAYHQLLAETLAWVQGQVERGERLEAIQQNGLPEPWDERFAEQADEVTAWIREIFRSLTGA
ncbi:MAG TPA: MBL fold metallo-hydrolase, partial [Rhodothermales bacterium]|nr:MBL fold metallo-hydrolase [Rhodothermales bacterium]